MKLSNSITALNTAYIEMNDMHPNLQELLGKRMKEVIATDTAKDSRRYASYLIWGSLAKVTRDAIIAESVPLSEWVGGYADVDDKHIDTLLKNSIINDVVSNVLSACNVKK